jgi:hypothetical protein
MAVVARRRISPVTRQRPDYTARIIEIRRKQFIDGHNWALLDAVDLCARTGRPVPLWAVDPFCSRYLSWLHFRAKTLDAAFKVDRPKGMHVGTAARHEMLRSGVVRNVLLLHEPPRTKGGKLRPAVPLDKDLFHRAGKSLGIPGAQVRTIWYESASAPLIKIFRALQRITKP